MLLSRHDEVVRIIFIVNYIFEIDAGRLTKIFEKFLIKNVRDAADFFDSRLGFAVMIDEIRCNGYG